ncbi:MAG: response regulator [Rubrivivax sp.]|nr:response regulator [Rubrivivax sp.]
MLLAEDNALNQELAVELLRRRGAHVEVVGNGLQAVERLQADGPDAFDVVLMDLQMPVLDGLEATRRLREQPRFAALPIVAFTAHALAEEAERSLAVGMQGYVTKPVNMPDLVRTLQPYCGRTRSADRDPRRAEVRPAAVAVDMPAVPGINLALALSHFDDSPALLRRTLRGFGHTYGGGVARWQTWIDTQNWAELQRAAHTLQGLAGTVGATAVRERAQELERHARTQDGTSATQSLQRLRGVLDGLVAALDDALPPDGPDLAAATAPGPLTLQPEHALAGLRDLLEQSDSQVSDWWKAHRVALRQALPAPVVRQVGMAINNFDFDTALKLLDGARRSSPSHAT